MILSQLQILITGKCGSVSFSFDPEKSDLILKDSTIIPSAEETAASLLKTILQVVCLIIIP